MKRFRLNLILLYLLGFLISPYLSSASKVIIEVTDGLGNTMSADNPFHPEILLLYSHTLDNDPSTTSQENIFLESGESKTVIPGMYVIQFTYPSGGSIMELDVKITGRKTTLKYSHLGRLYLRLKNGLGEYMTNKSSYYPVVSVGELPSKKFEYVDLVAGRSHSIQLNYNTEKIEVKGLEVSRSSMNFEERQDLQLVHFEALDGAGMAVPFKVSIHRGGMQRLQVEGYTAQIAHSSSSYTATFQIGRRTYNEYFKVSSEQSEQSVTMAQLGRVILTGNSASGDRDKIKFYFDNHGDVLILYQGDSIDVLAGKYDIQAFVGEDNPLERQIQVEAMKVQPIDISSQLGVMLIDPYPGVGDPNAIKVSISKDGAEFDEFTGGARLLLQPALYDVTFEYSKAHKVVRDNIELVANDSVIVDGDPSLSVLRLITKDALGVPISGTAEVYRADGDRAYIGNFESGEEVFVADGTYEVWHYDAFNRPIQDKVSVEKFDISEFQFGPKNLGRLAWSSSKGLRYSQDIQVTLLQKGIVILDNIGESKKVWEDKPYWDVPEGMYDVIFHTQDGKRFEKFGVLIQKGKATTVFLDQARLTFIAKNGERKNDTAVLALVHENGSQIFINSEQAVALTPGRYTGFVDYQSEWIQDQTISPFTIRLSTDTLIQIDNLGQMSIKAEWQGKWVGGNLQLFQDDKLIWGGKTVPPDQMIHLKEGVYGIWYNSGMNEFKEKIVIKPGQTTVLRYKLG